MEEEILACIYKKNLRYLHSGQISKYVFPLPRKEAHSKKISHLIIRVFVVAFTPQNEIIYLVQKRSRIKKSFPNYFTDSASGHVIYKKNLSFSDIKKDAYRELQEEFGINPKGIRAMKFYDLKTENDNITTEIAYVFLALVDYNAKINPNPDELDIHDSKFYTKTELEHVLRNEKYIDYSRSIWKNLLSLDLLDFFKKGKTKSNRYVTAFFIGRFQPLHHGHIYVLRNILKRCKNIKIGIGSSQLSHTKNDPFTGKERMQFIQVVLEKRKISKDRYQIYEIPDIFNASKWVDHVISIVGNFNIVYSNSGWVRQLFQINNYKIGKKFEVFKKKYNGANIRKLISSNNDMWVRLVPQEIVQLIKKIDGIERIKSLYADVN